MIPTGYVVDRAHAHDHMVRLLEGGYRVWFAYRGGGVQILARPSLLGCVVVPADPADGDKAAIATHILHFLDSPQIERVELPDDYGPSQEDVDAFWRRQQEFIARYGVGARYFQWERDSRR